MRSLLTLIVVCALGGLLYMTKELSQQNDRLMGELKDRDTRILDLDRQLRAATSTGKAEGSLIQQNLEQLKSAVDREQGALDVAKAKYNQIKNAGISDEDIARADEDVRLQKDRVDGVEAQLQGNRAQQADLRGQEKNGIAVGSGTKVSNEQQYNAQITLHQQNIGDIKAQLQAERSNYDANRVQTIAQLGLQLRQEQDAITTLRQNKQSYDAQWASERNAFETDAQGKLGGLKTEEDGLKTRDSTERAELSRLQKASSDLKANRGNRAAAMKQADQDVQDHANRLKSLQAQLQAASSSAQNVGGGAMSLSLSLKRSFAKSSLPSFSVFALALASCASPQLARPRAPSPLRAGMRAPLVVGHRGAAGYAPEHTILSYTLALDKGADFIEPDLVMTKDGVLLIRHEPEISMTTDVEKHPEFASRKTAKMIDGDKMEGWFTEDFTLVEIRTLRAKERLPFRSHQEDFKHSLVTFEEFLQFTREQEKKRGKTIGIIPEIKHSSYFHGLGFDPEQALVELLKKYGFDTSTAPVIIQSLEVDNLKRLRKMTKVELVQLIDDPWLVPGDAQVAHRAQHFSDLATKEGLASIAEYADWVSPDKAYIYPRDKANRIDKPSSFVEDAHRAGLKVLPWTFRKEEKFLPVGVDLKSELLLYYKQGVDGVFTDFADIAYGVRAAFWGRAVRR